MNKVSVKRNGLYLFILLQVLATILNALCILSHLILIAALWVDSVSFCFANKETEALRSEVKQLQFSK